MDIAKSYASYPANCSSILALLIDDIIKLSPSGRKLLWMELNKEKLKIFAREIDQAVIPHQYSSADLDALIAEAKKSSKNKG